MCGKGSNTTTTVSAPPPQVTAAYQEIANRAYQAANTPYQPYPGGANALVATPNQGMLNAIGQITDIGLGPTYNQYLNTAAQYAQQGAQPIVGQLPATAAANMNPYAALAAQYGPTMGEQLANYSLSQGNQIANYAQQGAQALANAGWGTGQGTSNYGLDAAQGLAQAGWGAGNAISNYATNAASGLGGYATDAGANIAQLAQQGAQNLINTTAELGSGVSNFGTQQGANLGNWAANTGGGLAGLGQSLGSGIGGFASGAGQALGNYATGAGANIGNYATQGGQNLAQSGTAAGNALGAYGHNAGANVADYGMSSGNNLAAFGVNAGLGLSEYGDAAGQGVANYAVNKAAAAPQFQNFSGQAVGQYMDPYRQQVVDATLANINKNDAIQQNDLLGRAIASGNAFGGDRMGVAAAELARNQGLARNQVISNLLSQGYGQALGQFNTNNQQAQQAAQMGLSGLLSGAQLGTNALSQGAQLGTSAVGQGAQIGTSAVGQGAQIGTGAQQAGAQLGQAAQQAGLSAALQGQQAGANIGLQGQQAGANIGLQGQTAAANAALQGAQAGANVGLQGQQAGLNAALQAQTAGSQLAASGQQAALLAALQGTQAGSQLGLGGLQNAAQLGSAGVQAGNQLGVNAQQGASQLGLSSLQAGGQMGLGAQQAALSAGLQGTQTGSQLGASGLQNAASLGLQGQNLGAQGYSQAQQLGLTGLASDAARQQAASNQFGTLGNQWLTGNLGGATAALQAATIPQQYEQAVLDKAYQLWQQQQGYPFATTQFLSNNLLGTAGSQGGTSMSTGPAPNQTGSVLGGLGLLASGIAALKRGGRVGYAFGGGLGGALPDVSFVPTQPVGAMGGIGIPIARTQQQKPDDLSGVMSSMKGMKALAKKIRGDKDSSGTEGSDIGDGVDSADGGGPATEAVNAFPGAENYLFKRGGLVPRRADGGGLDDDERIWSPDEFNPIDAQAPPQFDDPLSPRNWMSWESKDQDGGIRHGTFDDLRKGLAAAEPPTPSAPSAWALDDRFNAAMMSPEAALALEQQEQQQSALPMMAQNVPLPQARPPGLGLQSEPSGLVPRPPLQIAPQNIQEDDVPQTALAYDRIAPPQGGLRPQPALAAPAQEEGGFLDRFKQQGGLQGYFDRFANSPLTHLSLGLMSSRSPFLGQQLGEGALMGLSSYAAAKKLSQDAAAVQARLKQQDLAQQERERHNRTTEDQNERFRKEQIEARKDATKQRSEDRDDALSARVFPGEEMVDGVLTKGLYQFNPKTREYDFKPGKSMTSRSGSPNKEGQTERLVAQLRKEDPTLTYAEALALTKRAPSDQAQLSRERLALAAAKADSAYFSKPDETLEKYRKRYGLTPTAPSAPAAPKAKAPEVGEIRRGYRYKGGDPAKPESWEKV